MNELKYIHSFETGQPLFYIFSQFFLEILQMIFIVELFSCNAATMQYNVSSGMNNYLLQDALWKLPTWLTFQFQMAPHTIY